jgi:hypothetical protein
VWRATDGTLLAYYVGGSAQMRMQLRQKSQVREFQLNRRMEGRLSFYRFRGRVRLPID